MSPKGIPCLVFLLAFITSSNGLDLIDYLQPNDVDNGEYDDLTKSSGSLCTRKCDGKPMTCYFKFNLENYAAMGPACGNCASNLTECNNRYCVTADGINRNILTVNRRLPGTPVQVCQGDTVVVDVFNGMAGKVTSIHWHGLLQKGSPHMDGVYMVTQCPIADAQTFRYKFVANDPGTHFWHDHSGFTKEDGIQGPLIVRRPDSEEPHSKLYDYDLPSHTLFLTDWKDYIADNEFPEMGRDYSTNIVKTLLVNGKGAFPTVEGSSPAQSIIDEKGPITKLTVEQGKRYRLRIIGATCMDCPVEISIEKHKLLVIATDGNSIEPVTVDSVVLLTGERYDVVVTADQDLSSFWIKVRTIKPCGITEQYGVLNYKGALSSVPLDLPKDNSNAVLTTMNKPNFNENGQGERNYWIYNLQSADKINPAIKRPISNYVNLIELGMYTYSKDQFKNGNMKGYFQSVKGWNSRSMVNNVTSLIPPAPLLTQMNDVPKESFCSEECMKGLAPDTCNCIQNFHFPLNKTVDFIVADMGMTGSTVHPFHMHGHRFYILEQGTCSYNKRQQLNDVYHRVKNGLIKFSNPVAKDTVLIPSGGYAVIRFYTDNPGVWVFHCHYIYHNALGMNAYLQAGSVEDFPATPEGFPKCGNYLPSL